ncbi:IS110 family transposase [Micromonospora sp. NBRC 110037]|uniref:IS110 family transposase n=1 Tax=Micromonospora sp. NBRC 110037 TaxID=1621261 RepID=UPI0007DB3899|nr:IS110 family transposase [Micromonospora sp. NBRC 110037]
MSKVFCGIDWAERHHDVALVDEHGELVAKRRIHETVEGWQQLLDMMAAAGDTAEDPIPVAIETPRGLLVAALRASSRPVYAINPMAVSRYRDRHSVSRSKSDHADAMVLANILRTDAHVHRALPADTELARAIAVLARAQQDATWRRTKASNELRSLLREYYPAFLDAFINRKDYLTSSDARAILAVAPTPAAGAKLSKARIAAALRRGGRQRGIDALAAEIQQALRVPHLRQPSMIEDAMGTTALALLATLNTECANVAQLGEACAQAFTQHPDYQIITSFPGLGDLTGARVLAELGDDRARFTDARAVKAYAGSAPVTRASGRSISITHRRVKNDRLAAAGWVWAFVAATNSPHAREHYKRRREVHADRHAAALRHLFNRLIGCLHQCLTTRQLYDETKAFPTRNPTLA